MVITCVNKIQAPKIKYININWCIGWSLWHKHLLSLMLTDIKIIQRVRIRCFWTSYVVRRTEIRATSTTGPRTWIGLKISVKCSSPNPRYPEYETQRPQHWRMRQWRSARELASVSLYLCSLANRTKKEHIYRKKRIKPSTKPPR